MPLAVALAVQPKLGQLVRVQEELAALAAEEDAAGAATKISAIDLPACDNYIWGGGVELQAVVDVCVAREQLRLEREQPLAAWSKGGSGAPGRPERGLQAAA